MAGIFATREEFQSRSPCTKPAGKNPNDGWYKNDLLKFCVQNQISGCDTKSTKPQLCKAIARFFDGMKDNIEKLPDSEFKSKSCQGKGDGKTAWRVSDLQQMVKRLGLPMPKKISKPILCAQLAAYFRDNEAKPKLSIEQLSIDKLRELCIKRGLKGCHQTKKRETFISKLKSIKQDLPPEKRPDENNAITSPKKHDMSSDNISIGDRPTFDGELDRLATSLTGNISALIYLLRTHRKNMCLALPKEYVELSDFARESYCDFEICWLFDANVKKGKLQWPYENNEERIWTTMKEKCKKRFVIIPIYIKGKLKTLEQEDYVVVHHNYAILDWNLKTFERFEPNGTSTGVVGRVCGEDLLDASLDKSAGAHGFKYIPPVNFCPALGLHAKQYYKIDKTKPGDPKGFCTFWSVWYADRRLKYPDMPPKELLKRIMSKMEKHDVDLHAFIRNFTEFIDVERRKIIKLAKETNKDASNEDILIGVLYDELFVN